MLQIRLNKDSSAEGGGGGMKTLPGETVTVACPDHLILADLPVAKSLGVVTSASLVKTVGRRSRRQLGDRVHFCVCCDYPIAIYGRLSPCEHAFCLHCARSDSICYLCDERIQKIQTIKMMEGIFICAAPHCLKSFLKRAEFETHIHEIHANLFQPNQEKEDDSEAISAKQSSMSEFTARAPSMSGFSPSSNSQIIDREDNSRQQSNPRPMLQSRPPFFGQSPNRPSESQTDNSRPPGFDRPAVHFSDTSYPSVHNHQPSNFAVPMTPNLGQNLRPPFNYPQFTSEGAQPYYNAPYEIPRSDSVPEVRAEQGSLLGFTTGQTQTISMNFAAGFSQPWNAGAGGGVSFVPSPGSQGNMDGFVNSSYSQGSYGFYQGDFGRNSGGFPINTVITPSTNKATEPGQDGKG